MNIIMKIFFSSWHFLGDDIGRMEALFSSKSGIWWFFVDQGRLSIISFNSLTLPRNPYYLQRNEKYFTFSVEIFCSFANANTHNVYNDSDSNNSSIYVWEL